MPVQYCCSWNYSRWQLCANTMCYVFAMSVILASAHCISLVDLRAKKVRTQVLPICPVFMLYRLKLCVEDVVCLLFWNYVKFLFRNYVKFLIDRNGQPVKRYGPGALAANFFTRFSISHLSTRLNMLACPRVC
jgi:hypothetical protein